MIDLKKALVDYLVVRRALGFKLQWAEERISSFLDHLERASSPIITTALAVEWATLPRGTKPGWWAHRLAFVRPFARYVQSLDPRTEVPPAGLFRIPTQRQPVHIYSEEEVLALMAATETLKSPFKALTFSTLIGLLSVTGMRIGEVIALDRSDVDWDDGVLTIRDSKFGKSREVIVHPTTVEALRRLARARDRRFPHSPCPAFFVSVRDTRLNYGCVQRTFHLLIDRTGLSNRQPRRPRIHDMRHSFASRTLRDWHQAGVDVERKLPLLSTYLGHVNPATTYWYLTALPELMEPAMKRLEERLGDLP